MFETFEHKADIGIRGFGKSLEEAFGECAKAMFSVVADLEKVEAVEAKYVRAEAENRESLLVAFLNELLFLHDSEEMVFKKFELSIGKNGEKLELNGKAFGEKTDKERHGIKSGVKAASYHQLKVGKENARFVAQCIVDV